MYVTVGLVGSDPGGRCGGSRVSSCEYPIQAASIRKNDANANDSYKVCRIKIYCASWLSRNVVAKDSSANTGIIAMTRIILQQLISRPAILGSTSYEELAYCRCSTGLLYLKACRNINAKHTIVTNAAHAPETIFASVLKVMEPTIGTMAKY